MATLPRQQIGSPQIFTSDPTEQIFAKGALDRDMGGIAYAYLNAARGNRADEQQVYLQNLRNANEMSARLAMQQEGQETMREALKQIAPTTNAGYSAEDIPIISQLVRSGNSNPGALHRALLAADAQHKLAQAAHAGDAGADKYEASGDTTTTGAGGATYKVISRDPNRAQAGLARTIEQDARLRNLPPPPAGSPMGRPTTNSMIDQMKQRDINNRKNLGQ